MDRVIRGIAEEGTIRVMAAITTEMLAEAIGRHRTAPTASAAFGRVLTGTVLLASTLKDFDRLTVKVECDGPIGGITAEAKPDGKVRGYVKNPLADLPLKNNGKFDVSGVVGKGTLYVIREEGFDVGLYREPYYGSVPLISGEIAEDFAYYLAKSEQIPSAVLLGVLLQREEPYVRACGGLMIQVMPGADEKVVQKIEETIKKAPQLTTFIDQGASVEDIIKMGLGDISFQILQETTVKFDCGCSMQRAISMVSALDKKEIESMLREDKGAKITCGFCNETYELGEETLLEILKNLD
ncbi:MAG: Hsp33 family molecular chaperone HslO [Pyrinomonadaceae bacterium]|nr:Hsp33 family molecular chaperone HslO [Pyrinomonadaceae bacterium]MCX7638851.1 Hsp33 family molecular chaperone HslO [Pyrinomonadaceae bacterium]MDW8305013.1 Hsp33 family molecular chaperone HslO [Acidobacteriota bacterium]